MDKHKQVINDIINIMRPEEQTQKIKELDKRIKTLENLLLSINSDPRFVAKIRNSVVEGEHTSGKPIIVSSNGKRYNLQTI